MTVVAAVLRVFFFSWMQFFNNNVGNRPFNFNKIKRNNNDLHWMVLYTVVFTNLGLSLRNMFTSSFVMMIERNYKIIKFLLINFPFLHIRLFLRFFFIILSRCVTRYREKFEILKLNRIRKYRWIVKQKIDGRSIEKKKYNSVIVKPMKWKKKKN